MSVDKLGTRWLEVDLGQWVKNLQVIKRHVHPTRVLPVLKADAYGHGLVEIARTLSDADIHCFAVACLEEAILCREHFNHSEILILGAIPESQIPDVINYNLTPTVCEKGFAKVLSDQACRFGQKVACHFYVDTGMGRMGFNEKHAQTHLDYITTLPGLNLKAIYSHYPVSDECDLESRSFSKEQRKKFLSFCSSQLPGPLPRHLANSGGILQYSHEGDSFVRPGLICYGVSPNPELKLPEGIKPILKLKCRPLHIKSMSAGESVGYGRAYTLKKTGYIMTLPVGYADGVPRSLSGQMEVHVDGKNFPVIGKICMDMMMVDLGNHHIPVDREVTLLGGGAQNIQQWSKLTGMIPYELLSGLGKRWTKAYLREGSLVQMLRQV